MVALRWVHRWLGGMLAIFIMLIAVTGGMLVIKEPVQALIWPVFSSPITLEQKKNYAEILQSIQKNFKHPTVTFVRFPRQGKNVFHLWLSDGSEAYVHPTSAETLKQWVWYKSFSSILYQLHAHLLMGEMGESLVGTIGIAALFFILSGIVLWWPRRRSLRKSHLRPSFKFPIRAHQAIGIVSALPIFFFIVTGCIMVFYTPTAKFITNIVDQTIPMKLSVVIDKSDDKTKPWGHILQVIEETLPGGELQSWGASKKNNAAYIFRKKMPEEWHPYGRSFIALNPYQGTVVETVDAREQAFGMRLMEKVYPLHASKIGGTGYRTTAILTASATLIVSLLGLTSFYRRIRAKIYRKKSLA